MNNGTATVATDVEISEGQILNTLDAGFRTIGGLKRKLGVPAYKDISGDLEFLVDAGKLIKLSNNTVTAYFRANEKPERFWLAGDGRVNAEFAGESEKAASTPVRETPKRGGAWKKVELTPEAVEKAAAKHARQPEMAKELGCSVSLLSLRLQKKEFREAYDRGRATRGDAPKDAPKVKRKYTRKVATQVPEPAAITEEGPTITPPAEIDPPKLVHSRFVTFGRGGQLLLAYEGSLFDLGRDEFELITSIADLLTNFEEAKTEA